MLSHLKRNRATRTPGRLARWMALLPASCVLLYPLYLARQLDTVEERYVSAALPQAFDGLRIVFFSDVHYGALFGENRVRELVERVNGLKPDLILMAGDYGDDSDSAVRFFALKPAWKASCAVLGSVGNHDRTVPEGNLALLRRAMEENGVIPLINDVWTLEKDGKKLAVAGIDDVYNGFPDVERVEKLCRGADFTIFVPHSPDVIPALSARPEGPFYHLLLCGHTHGGQVTLLGRSLHPTAMTRDRYRSGWYREAGADILVTNGVGTTGYPVRLGARAQIHLLILSSGH